MDALKAKEFLYISYLSPPLLAGGVVRAENNCKLLPEFGWKPTLLSATIDGAEESDQAYAQRGVEIVRPKGFFRENRVRALPIGSGKKRASFRVSLARTLARWLLVPDRKVIWKGPAERLAVRLAPSHNWECVFAALHPISAVWAGRRIADKLNLPFILEFQDIVGDELELHTTAFHQKIRSKIMQKAVGRADRVVVMSNNMKKWVVDTYKIAPELVEVIPIGYVPADRELVHSFGKPTNDRFTMVYAGTFQRHRKPDTVLKAVKDLINQNKIPKEKLRLIFIGNLVPSVISDFGLEGVAETISMIPREEVFKWYAKSDLLLLICDKCQYQNFTVPGKIFEYMMTEKPILGLADKNSEIAQILSDSGVGYTADADDVGEVAEQIYGYYTQWNSGKLDMRPDRDFIGQFSSQKLVEKLVDVMEAAKADYHKK